jgi:hypothetical protein
MVKYNPNMSDEEFNNLMKIIQENIKTAAYYKWQAAGCPTDEYSRHSFWLEAEKEAFLEIGLISEPYKN